MHRAQAFRRRRSRFGTLSSRAALAFASLVLICTCPCAARADDADDFIFAASEYQNGDFAVAIARLRPLVGDREAHVRPSLVEPARRYYAAALALTNQEQEAVEVFQWLLRDNPDAQLNPRDFPPSVIHLFQQTRDAMSAELGRIRADRIAQQRAHDDELARERLALNRLASSERVVLRTPRWLTFVPFGVGQYANGSPALGALFTTVEALGVGTMVGTGVALAAVGLPDDYLPRCHESVCGPLIGAFWTGAGVLALGALVGVIEANASWRAERVTFRPRAVPPELRDLHFSVAPTPVGRGALVTATLRF